MGARVSFLDDAPPATKDAPSARAVVVPNEAVQANGDTGVVFIVQDNKVERRAVRLGAKNSDGQIVLAGLNAGTQIAVGNLSALTDQAKVQITSPTAP